MMKSRGRGGGGKQIHALMLSRHNISLSPVSLNISAAARAISVHRLNFFCNCKKNQSSGGKKSFACEDILSSFCLPYTLFENNTSSYDSVEFIMG